MFSWVDHSESLVFKHNCLFDVSFRSPNGPDKGKIIEYFMLEPISGEELGTTRHRPVVTAATPNNGESTSSRERETKCFHCEWRPLDLDAFLVT